MTNSTLIAVLGVSVMASIIGIIFDVLALSGASCVFFLVFAVFSGSAVQKQPESASRHADNVYFLGYILTILGLGGVAYRIGLNPLLIENPLPLIHRAAFALSSTVFGLVGMMVIKNMIVQPNEENASTLPDLMQQRVEAQMRSLATETEKLLRALRQAREEGIEELNAQFRKIDFSGIAETLRASLLTSAQEFASSLEKSELHLSGLAEQVKRLSEDASSLVTVLPKFTSRLESLALTYQSHHQDIERFLGNGVAVESLNHALSSAEKTLAAVGQNAIASQSETEELTKCIKELRTSVESFIKLTQTSLAKGLNNFQGEPAESKMGNQSHAASRSEKQNFI